MVLLYLNGELENRLVVGAANKTEYRIGFFVKHGCDDDADIMPILGLYKTQVRELARYLNVPADIREKPPSPDIIPGITDEEAIGIPYEELDLTLMAIEKGWELPDSWIGFSQHAYETKPLRTERLTAAEVLEFRDKAFMQYFTSPQYLSLVERKFGKEVVEHLAEMTKIKLRRKIVEEAQLLV